MPFSDRNNVTPSRATKRVEIKLTEQEHWVTSQRAAQYNLSLTEFIRRKTIGTRLPEVLNPEIKLHTRLYKRFWQEVEAPMHNRAATT